jgi:hypothetical protein
VKLIALFENLGQQEFLELFVFFGAGVFDLEFRAIVGGGAHDSRVSCARLSACGRGFQLFRKVQPALEMLAQKLEVHRLRDACIACRR